MKKKSTMPFFSQSLVFYHTLIYNARKKFATLAFYCPIRICEISSKEASCGIVNVPFCSLVEYPWLIR
jgi:hypothetical protein